jgi:hypothetical protein
LFRRRFRWMRSSARWKLFSASCLVGYEVKRLLALLYKSCMNQSVTLDIRSRLFFGTVWLRALVS